MAILELYPDGSIGQLLPGGFLTSDESRLEPGQEALVKDLVHQCLSAAPPYGNYMFKLFATESPSRFFPHHYSPRYLTRERFRERGSSHPRTVGTTAGRCPLRYKVRRGSCAEQSGHHRCCLDARRTCLQLSGNTRLVNNLRRNHETLSTRHSGYRSYLFCWCSVVRIAITPGRM